MTSKKFLRRCLLFDVEINEKNVIYSVGAVLGDDTFKTKTGQPVDRRTLKKLDTFGRNADYILGHNIVTHDIPKLKEVDPELGIVQKPAIDTLYLSPLAYPANPYHRLVKNYKLVRDSVNDPAQDATLAGRVFAEQWEAFDQQLKAGFDTVVLYRSFLQKNRKLWGTAAGLGEMGVPALGKDELLEPFGSFAKNHACVRAVEELIDQINEGDLEQSVLAYVVAWLSVAGGNSVLPPWVRHQFPQISGILYKLREVSCGISTCVYCKTHHNPKQFLKTYFGFESFRSQPATEQGKSLQGEVVAAGTSNSTLFATLPTGGGKSLCYLLPGLMRFQRRNLLTIVISPLQALMKDQVDNFSKQTGTRLAAAIYGMLTLPERGEVMEAVRLGDVGILYVSPEQLRNYSFVNTINQREIGAWVFDEAHCLSKWGHDFRPDYFYAIRFIREFAQENKAQIPPVQCFTATAKREVRSEISDIIQRELSLRVEEYEGGHERTNLHYEVQPVETHEKFGAILELLRSRFSNNGSVVIYCATQKKTEKLAEFLQEAGYTTEPFHADIDSSRKKRILEQFIEGDIPVICATNAFGMGIDKDDVRLVIHADIPGSLENYLQEAGRAGRDRQDAECVLVFDEQDIEGQFRLSSMSRLTRREIAQMLRGIRSASRGQLDVVLTAGELVRRDDVDIDPTGMHDVDTRVRTAIAWLERAGFLQRNENSTKVFQGKPLVRDLEEAAKKIANFDLSARQRERWLALTAALMEKGMADGGFSADELAGIGSFAQCAEDQKDQTETQRVLQTLHDMADSGLLSKETTLTAFVRYQVKNSATVHLPRLCKLEREFLKCLVELAPDADLEAGLELDLRQVNQELVELGYDYTTPHVLKNILYGLRKDGKGLAGQSGSIRLKAKGDNRFSLVLLRDWESLLATVRIRQRAAEITLKKILSTVSASEKPNKDLLVEFTLEQVVEALNRDLELHALLRNPLAAAERALTFLHEHTVIDLQHGLAIFNQAMTLRLEPESKGRLYSADDFEPLRSHYKEKNFQIHVMNEYARKALERISNAMRLVASYFNDDKEDFVKRYFPGKNKVLDRATSEQSYSRIVDDLKNKAQAAVVSAPIDRNMLVLAGPGAGKTRVVIHRVAYLLRVKRVSPGAILVLCFNRSAVTSLRRKLRDLVGGEMAWVTTLTFHSLALRLTGRSLVTATNVDKRGDIDFSLLIQDAITLLRGDADALGFEGESARDALVGKFSHILVDEYQDIDEEQYEMVSLLAGRTEKEHDRKMAILAVGDDDQNIYQFRGANLGFIRRYNEDYHAQNHYLIENYRSTAHIIEASNSLIQNNVDRMKTEHPIRVNEARRKLPAGGNWQINDSLGQGKVQILQVDGIKEQGFAVVEEIERLRALEGRVDLNNCAVLAREWKDLDLIRAIFEARSIPINFHWGRGGGFPHLRRIRENSVFLDYLKSRRGENIAAFSLQEQLPDDQRQDNPWQQNLRQLIEDWSKDTNNTEQPVSLVEEFFHEALADQALSRNLGNGVFLSTVHSVKGLEFDHVFMLGTNWGEKQGEELEEERRLFYVGMTRARETLQLLDINGSAHPHLSALVGGSFTKRTLQPSCPVEVALKNYSLLGMKDLYIDFLGSRRESSVERIALSELKTDDHVSLILRNDQIEVVDEKGVSVGRLSQRARVKWSDKLKNIVAVKVVAVVRRKKDDIGDEAFRSRCQGESWEVPVLEIGSC